MLGEGRPTVDELRVADPPEAWRDAGFTVHGDVSDVGSVRLRLEGHGPRRGIVGWAVRGTSSLELDGLPTSGAGGGRARPGEPGRDPAARVHHPNGVLSIDHLVVMSPDLDRTLAGLRAAGLDFRRLREAPTPGGSMRQGFFRMGELILEVVEAPPGSRIRSDPRGPARLWGISFLVEDIERTAAALGDLLGTPRAAVQPGRTIATLSRSAGLGPAVAFMTPGVGAA